MKTIICAVGGSTLISISEVITVFEKPITVGLQTIIGALTIALLIRQHIHGFKKQNNEKPD